jgi:predicted Rossmann fold flavoprotein
MGATGFGYNIAKQFGLKVNPQTAGLVPFIFKDNDCKKYSTLKGVSAFCSVSNNKTSFSENILFTHKGLSGPAILQISSYWKAGESINIDLSPTLDIAKSLSDKKSIGTKASLKNILSELFPKSLVATFFDDLVDVRVCDLTLEQITVISSRIHSWTVYPQATEGYRTAEVTLGGVSCDELSSKTMETNSTKGLYFIGEVVDVTGWLGGYNFQWAWAAGWAAGQVV